MDKISKEQRSKNMSKIRSTDTKPEVFLRRELFARGFRYRKNVGGLQGRPDIVLKKYGAAVFVHGCFWHGHKNCNKSRIPETNREFWAEKIAKNIARDERTVAHLRAHGWRVLIVWTCALSNKEKAAQTVQAVAGWLKTDDSFAEIS